MKVRAQFPFVPYPTEQIEIEYFKVPRVLFQIGIKWSYKKGDYCRLNSLSPKNASDKEGM